MATSRALVAPEIDQALGHLVHAPAPAVAVRTERWGLRVVDVDILTYDEEEIDEPGLTVPHPRMHERAFVLIPLLELDPDPMLPGGGRIAALRLPPGAFAGVRPFAPPLFP